MIIFLDNTCYFTNTHLIKKLDPELEINSVCLSRMCKSLGLCPRPHFLPLLQANQPTEEAKFVSRIKSCQHLVKRKWTA